MINLNNTLNIKSYRFKTFRTNTMHSISKHDVIRGLSFTSIVAAQINEFHKLHWFIALKRLKCVKDKQTDKL